MSWLLNRLFVCVWERLEEPLDVLLLQGGQFAQGYGFEWGSYIKIVNFLHRLARLLGKES